MKHFNYYLFFLTLLLIVTSCSLSERHVEFEIDDKFAQKSLKMACSVPIIDAVNGVESGTANLRRNRNKISMNYKAEGLAPGYAYTVWWVIWNNPEFCATPLQCIEPDFGIADQVEVEVLYAAGHVIGESGKGYFSASLNENDNTASINEDVFGLPSFGGLLDAQKAEVHLVLRSHGPAIPGQVNEQINSYPGGCEVNFPPFTEIPDAEGECGDYMFAIFAPTCGN